MATKMKELGWGERDRNSQAANALWPHLAPPDVQKQMLDRAGRDPNGDRAGLARRIAEGNKAYGKPNPPKADPSNNYHLIPTLRRK